MSDIRSRFLKMFGRVAETVEFHSFGRASPKVFLLHPYPNQMFLDAVTLSLGSPTLPRTERRTVPQRSAVLVLWTFDTWMFTWLRRGTVSMRTSLLLQKALLGRVKLMVKHEETSETSSLLPAIRLGLKMYQIFRSIRSADLPQVQQTLAGELLQYAAGKVEPSESPGLLKHSASSASALKAKAGGDSR